MFQNEQRITITARDLKVVSALQCDGRMTMQALADKVGISVYAATESYRRLTESNIMSIVPRRAHHWRRTSGNHYRRGSWWRYFWCAAMPTNSCR